MIRHFVIFHDQDGKPMPVRTVQPLVTLGQPCCRLTFPVEYPQGAPGGPKGEITALTRKYVEVGFDEAIHQDLPTTYTWTQFIAEFGVVVVIEDDPVCMDKDEVTNEA